MYRIKPHHFIDMIKLYGGGRESFTPDLAYGHSFYLVANEIMRDPNTKLWMTIRGDDVCNHCKYRDASGFCTDTVSHIEGVVSKDAYNKSLDKRIMDLLDMKEGETFTAYEMCLKLSTDRDIIKKVWVEDISTVERRQELFWLGLDRYIAKWNGGARMVYS